MAKYDIIQETYSNDPWKVLVCCILLNQTNNKQVRPLIEKFFLKWPDHFSVKPTEKESISNFIKSTGFQNIKSERIIKLSEEWSKGNRDPWALPGVGDYGREAWRIFIDNDVNFTPKDKKLKMYVDSL
jgi:endonuclease III